MKTINEYIQKKHIMHVPGAEITDFKQMIEGNYYTLKHEYNDDYSIFKFQSFAKDDNGDYEIYYDELLSVDSSWNDGQMYFKNQNDGCNFLPKREWVDSKMYIATDEEIKEIEQARK